MRRTRIVLALVVLVPLLNAPEVRAGGSGGLEVFSKFTGPAFNVTVVLNPDSNSLNTGKGTVAIRVQKGAVDSGGIFFSGYVNAFANGCDGINGAFTSTPIGIDALTAIRFLGVVWIETGPLTALLAPFGITPSILAPAVFSNLDNPVCTKVGGFWILSFTATMQFGNP